MSRGDHTNLSVREDNAILFCVGYTATGEQLEDVSGIAFRIEDASIPALPHSLLPIR